MAQLNLKPASYLPPLHAASKGVLQRKCDCGNHSSGGQCEECNKKKIQRKLSVGANNDPLESEADRVADQVVTGAAVAPVSNFQAPLVQRDGPAVDTKTDEEKYKEGGKKVLEAFLETSVGKQLTEDAKKAMFDNWYGRIITGTTAVGTITALAAAEKELPAQLPEIPLDFLKPGLSVKFEYNGPVNKPTGAMLTFIFKEQGSAKKKPGEKFPELAPIRQAEKMFPRPQPMGGPDQKFWDQYQLQELQKRLPSLKPIPQQAPEKKSPFQLTPPEFGPSPGYKPPSLFGDQFKLNLDGDKKKKDDDKIQKKARVGASNDPLETEADAIADQVLANSAAPVRITPANAAIQRASADTESSAPSSVEQTVQGSGKPLDSNTREFMESRFGQDFSHVRIHQGSSAEQSARDVNAHAYTLGNNIVFGVGQYNPHSQAGKRLLAHELTHVLQQSGTTSSLQRKPAKKAAPTSPPKTKPTNKKEPKKEAKKNEQKAPKKTATNAPKMAVTASKNGAPCACLVVVHNDERNARKTAELMHANCAYNLALVNPDSGGREVHIPGKKGTVDPNSLFPPDIAESCLNNPKGCSDFLVDKANSTDPVEIEKFVQIQYFMSISECSNGFSLPVVALHNNDTEDTKNFTKNKKSAEKKDVDNLKMDIDKSKKETGDDRIAKLKEMIKDKFGGDKVVKETTETPGKTNIFRWCASKDLSQCHIGDPANPDNVTWVTNAADFAKLQTQNINVALQSELPGKKSESEGDLSTLFLHLPKIVAKGLFNDVSDVFRILKLLYPKLFLEEKLSPDVEQALKAMIGDMLHYVNIETPGKAISDQSDSERARNYDAIVAVLDTLGLHCCGKDTGKADEAIKGGLKLDK